MKRFAVVFLFFILAVPLILRGQDSSVPLVESMAEVTANNIFLSYLSVQCLYEKVQENECTPRQFENVSESVSSGIESIRMNLTDMKNRTSLSKGDIDFIGRIEDVYDLLKKDISLLEEYYDSGTESDHDEFFENHELVWEEMLNLYQMESGV
jgi:hypothetical protein